MEYFTNAKYVRIRSYHNKYLVAGSDGESVKQSRNSSTKEARWAVEIVQGKPNMIRLRSCCDKFLTASDEPFLLGWTGKKVLQTVQTDDSNISVHWEPVGEDFYVKLRSPLTGEYLRGNFSAPPWRNSVTIDVPERSATKDWIMWVVDILDDNGDDVDRSEWIRNSKSMPVQATNTGASYKASCSMPVDVARHSSSSSLIEAEEEAVKSTWHKNKSLSAACSPDSSASVATGYKNAMEIFQNAKTVRLRSHHDKYLIADDGGVSVIQDHQGGSIRAWWTVEYLMSEGGVSLVRLKSCYDKYLTATNEWLLLGMTGKKVKQTMPRVLDSSTQWEPIKDGMQVKLQTRYGSFLRANGRLQPWRNSITHDIPSVSLHQDWILWEIEVVEVHQKAKELGP